MPEQRFQNFITRVRPHRIAVLTNSADAYWQDTCLGILQFFTELWGGTHCIIVPTDGKTIDETFWALLSSHDPDTIYRYQRTGTDEQIRAPEQFVKMVAERVAHEARQAECAQEDIHAGIERAFLQGTFDHWEIAAELRMELLMRLAPFHFGKESLHGVLGRQLNILYISRGSNPSHPHTALIDVLRSSRRPSNIARLVSDIDDPPPPLWLASTVGSGTSSYYNELNQLGIVPVPLLMSQHEPSEIIRWGISPSRNLQAPSPFGLSLSALTQVMSTKTRRFEMPTVVVVGDTVQDFCLFHALYWQQGRAVWLPSWFTSSGDEYPQRLMTALNEAEAHGRLEHNEHFLFVSYSLDKTQLDRLKQKVDAHLFHTTITTDDIIPATVAYWVKHPSRVYTDGNLGDITTHLLYDKNLPGVFDSPLPRTLHPVNPQVHRWLVDITFMENLIPRHPALGHVVVTGQNVGDVRTGREEVTFMCPGFRVMGNHMETNMLRPSIHVPDAEEIFRVILAYCDFRSETSDKGRYEDTAVRKFGGLSEVGHALWSNKNRSLLMKFLDKAAPEKGVVDEGVHLRSDQRRYMDFRSINKVMQNDALSYNIIDEYVQKGVFYRGYIFQCENCSDAAWHSIAEVDQTFTCRRCGLQQQYRHQHWKNPNEPLWFYKLDEMVYLMLKNNGHVPLLTLNKLRLTFTDSFLFCSELRIFPVQGHKTFLEMDICCIANGRLCIGEAKRNGDLSGKDMTALQTANRYKDLALKMGASMVMFSTTEAAWNDASLNAIDEAFASHPHIKTYTWTSSMLCN